MSGIRARSRRTIFTFSRSLIWDAISLQVTINIMSLTMFENLNMNKSKIIGGGLYEGWNHLSKIQRAGLYSTTPPIHVD